ncbi:MULTISPECIES: SAM-dependent methyltransferase [Arthrobacter]|uniref:S-adenosyl-L-methionine-dependent methyltransferase n=1 Tax=Arthrobacter terricola TaxID=2547396 RepID=A0A4R5KCX3_9MICC|nr:MULTISPECIES: SAM-dependent methyltransferase [Arthrobacter]MBT8162839.1 SAM-dependent methyltransferase [Arthrobacter sp. GN70]TDF91930.1 SAM-dependent methyltransferase [Arthrobacter terricola]
MASHHDPQARASTINTGRWIAAARALETARPDRLFNDPWAGLLAGESGKAALDAADYNPFLPVRTRYFDDRITAATRKDCQIVLLGAGMDTRAFRLPLSASCTVFEIDYAEALTQKEALLRAELPVCERRCVPADLSGPWTQALLKAGFDRRKPTIWVAEGLFFYLTGSVVESLLRDTASLSAGGATFLADLFGTGLLALESMAPLVAARTRTRRPLPFCTDTPEALFQAAGWDNTSMVQPGEHTANFGRLTQAPTTGDAWQRSNLRTYLVTATL